MDKNSRKKVAIIGVGLMGGSLALSLSRVFPDFSIWGYARSEGSYTRIKKSGVCHNVDMRLGEVLSDADFVVLALPVYVIVAYLSKIAPFLKKGAVVFDLGSSKKWIESQARRVLPRTVSFVGCHPLCGSEKSGVEFSEPNLYAGAVCFITSSPAAAATKAVGKLWTAIGARTVFMPAARHDRVLAGVSHLPHVVSFALTQSVPAPYLEFSPPSLKDLTRISNSSPAVWKDIFASNRENILAGIDKFIEILGRWRRAVAGGRREKIAALIAKANSKQRSVK